jgi:hypothetical protein
MNFQLVDELPSSRRFRCRECRRADSARIEYVVSEDVGPRRVAHDLMLRVVVRVRIELRAFQVAKSAPFTLSSRLPQYRPTRPLPIFTRVPLGLSPFGMIEVILRLVVVDHRMLQLHLAVVTFTPMYATSMRFSRLSWKSVVGIRRTRDRLDQHRRRTDLIDAALFATNVLPPNCVIPFAGRPRYREARSSRSSCPSGEYIAVRILRRRYDVPPTAPCTQARTTHCHAAAWNVKRYSRST